VKQQQAEGDPRKQEEPAMARQGSPVEPDDPPTRQHDRKRSHEHQTCDVGPRAAAQQEDDGQKDREHLEVDAALGRGKEAQVHGCV
jgi:hypothetical protein